MIRRLRLGLVVVTLAVLQTTLFDHLRVLDVAPDLLLVATIALAYREGPHQGAGFGFVSGLTLDLLLSTPFGLSALAFSLTGYAVGIVQGGMVRASRWAAPVLGGLGGLLGNAIFVVAGGIAGEDQLLTVHSLRVMVVASAYDAVVAFAVFPLMAWAAHDADATRGRYR